LNVGGAVHILPVAASRLSPFDLMDPHYLARNNSIKPYVFLKPKPFWRETIGILGVDASIFFGMNFSRKIRLGLVPPLGS